MMLSIVPSMATRAISSEAIAAPTAVSHTLAKPSFFSAPTTFIGSSTLKAP